MELRHLRYFVAVAEAGSLTLAAEKRLHTAQPSLSRQMRDLERELGVKLMERGARGIELTASGKAFLDHARMALFQVEAGKEAARRAGAPAKASFAVGFLTGYEMEWLPALMDILRDQLSNTEIVIQSSDSPQLAAALMRGEIDAAFIRPEKQTSGLAYTLLRREPLIVVIPAGHVLAAQNSVAPQDLIGETLVGVPSTNAPELREVTDRYGAQFGIDLTPQHLVENLSMAISLVASMRGVCLLPLNARHLLPPSLVSRPIRGVPPTIDLVLAYKTANTSPLLLGLISRIGDLKRRVTDPTAAALRKLPGRPPAARTAP